MLLLAHRGHHQRYPENTIAAFEAAIACGVDGIETDVRLSADGLPILFHDATLADGALVAGFTREALSRAVGYPVPTLEEALDLGATLLWNLEVKVSAALPAVIALVGRTRAKVLVTSFHHELAVEAAQRLRVDSGLLLDKRPADLEELLARYRRFPTLRTLVWHFPLLDEVLLINARGAGWRQFAYGAESPAEHRRCAELGLDGLITDHPDRVPEG